MAGVRGKRLSGDWEKKIAMGSDRAFTESGRGMLVKWQVEQPN
ncbi:hypothetical protein [Microcoleus sp. T3_A4]